MSLLNMEDLPLNAESSIDEIKKRRAVCDYTSEEYKNKNIKKSQWIEICTVLYPDFDGLDGKEKVNIGTTLFQIEFISENAVRLYRNGSDIRISLGGIKMSSLNIPKAEVKDDSGDKIDNSCGVNEPTVCEELSENTQELAEVEESNNPEENVILKTQLDDNIPQNISIEERDVDESLTSELQVCDIEVNNEVLSECDQVKAFEEDSKLDINEENRSESTPADDSKNDTIETLEVDSFVHNEIVESDNKPYVDDSPTLDTSNDIDKTKENDKSPQKDIPGDSLVQENERLESNVESESTRNVEDKTIPSPKKETEIQETVPDSNKKQSVEDSTTLDISDDIDKIKDQDKSPQKDITQDSLIQDKEALESKTSPEMSSGDTNKNLEPATLLVDETNEADIESNKNQYVDNSSMLDVSNIDVNKINRDKSLQRDLPQASIIQKEEELEPRVEPESTRTVDEKVASSPKKDSENSPSRDTNEIFEVASLLHEEIEKALNKNDEQANSRSSSSCSGRIKHDDRILPGAVSRPRTPVENLAIDELESESEGLSGPEVANILKDLLDDALDKQDDIEVKSRPQSSGSGKISHDERIVPAVASRSHSPLQSEDNVKS